MAEYIPPTSKTQARLWNADARQAGLKGTGVPHEHDTRVYSKPTEALGERGVHYLGATDIAVPQNKSKLRCTFVT